jgi:hypothetical protein
MRNFGSPGKIKLGIRRILKCMNLGETIDAIKEFQTEREESKKGDMLKPSLDAVKDAINNKNPALFIAATFCLTNVCNNCHKAVELWLQCCKSSGDTASSVTSAFKINILFNSLT